jgi:predicted Zn finger-like uncharacterized protein
MKATITCPVCGTKYSLDTATIPEQGGMVTCKKCGSKIAVSKDTLEKEDLNASVFAKPPHITAQCPKCGLIFEVETGKMPEKERAEKITVLLLEDDPFFCNFIKETLQEKYMLFINHTLNEALETLRREVVHIILLDLTLGQENGRDFLKKIEKKCPILIVTAHDEIDMYGDFWEELKNLGADDIIHKSINMEDILLTRMESLLKGYPFKED